jgi:hypothetical protein
MTRPAPARAAPASAPGLIVIFDRDYVDFADLFGLLIRGVFWVTGSNVKLQLRVVKKRLRRPAGKIEGDDEVSPPRLSGSTPSVCVASPP